MKKIELEWAQWSAAAKDQELVEERMTKYDIVIRSMAIQTFRCNGQLLFSGRRPRGPSTLDIFKKNYYCSQNF